MNTPADPAQWNKVSAIEPAERGKQPEPVPGIPPVRQPLALERDEWTCTGCGGHIESDDNSTYIQHGHGCAVIAAIARQVTGR